MKQHFENLQQPKKSKILILDFGSQYTQLIARRIREIGVYCEIYRFDIDKKIISDFNPNGIILSGGPNSVNTPNSPKIQNVVFELNVPVLGICYGMQAMAVFFGGQVKSVNQREYGSANITITNQSELLAPIQNEYSDNRKPTAVWMSHGDQVEIIPDDFISSAMTPTCNIAVMTHKSKKLYGVQFHPEVTHTACGKEILEKFVIDICQCEKTWTPKNIISELISTLRKKIGEENVILGLSGGVDSSVAAALLNKAIGKQLTCIFINTGLLRLNEEDEIKEIFGKNYDIKLVVVDAKKQFLHALKGISDPEEKRKAIGKTFINVFAEEAKKIGNIACLAQGTIYPDVIESGCANTKTAHSIKSHHNVGGLPDILPFKLIEPLRELFKDEVRKIGDELGLPKELVYRHPFPGPGLGVRILGEIKNEYIEILQKADAIYIEELRTHGYYDKVNQAFAVFLPVKSVGVTGDERNYSYVISIRAVETTDFMTAKWAKLPYDLLESVSNRIINEVKNVSRVVYDISNKPPATIEWE